MPPIAANYWNLSVYCQSLILIEEAIDAAKSGQLIDSQLFDWDARILVLENLSNQSDDEDEIELETKGLAAPQSPAALQYSGPSETGEVKTTAVSNDVYANTGRNEPCPCGSGIKFKKCHGAAG
jgi:preprotein translocase subunit SecA